MSALARRERPLSTISLPNERIEQIREGGADHDLGLTETVVGLINLGIEQGLIKDRLHVFDAVPIGGGVFIAVRGVSFPPLTTQEARPIAVLFEHAAERGKV